MKICPCYLCRVISTSKEFTDFPSMSFKDIKIGGNTTDGSLPWYMKLKI